MSGEAAELKYTGSMLAAVISPEKNLLLSLPAITVLDGTSVAWSFPRILKIC